MKTMKWWSRVGRYAFIYGAPGLFIIAVGWAWALSDAGWKGWDNFPVTMFSTLTGILGAILVGYAMLQTEQRMKRDDEREMFTSSLVLELQYNVKRLEALDEDINNWSSPAGVPIVFPRLIISTVQGVLATGKLTLFDKPIQTRLRELVWECHDFNNRQDLVETYILNQDPKIGICTAIYKASGRSDDLDTSEIARTVLDYVKRMLSGRTRELLKLNNGLLKSLQKDGS